MTRLFLAILFTLVLSTAADDGFKSRIKNVVVLVEENRSLDNFCGDFDYKHVFGLVGKKFCNPVNVTQRRDQPEVCAAPTSPNVEPDDPNHSISGVNMQLYETWHPDEAAIKAGTEKATMEGFLYEQEVT